MKWFSSAPTRWIRWIRRAKGGAFFEAAPWHLTHPAGTSLSAALTAGCFPLSVTAAGAAAWAFARSAGSTFTVQPFMRVESRWSMCRSGRFTWQLTHPFGNSTAALMPGIFRAGGSGGGEPGPGAATTDFAVLSAGWAWMLEAGARNPSRKMDTVASGRMAVPPLVGYDTRRRSR